MINIVYFTEPIMYALRWQHLLTSSLLLLRRSSRVRIWYLSRWHLYISILWIYVLYVCILCSNEQRYTLYTLTKITTAKSEVVVSNHRLGGVHFLAVIFAAIIVASAQVGVSAA